VEDGDGEFVVFDVHGEHGVAGGAGHEGVGEVDVGLGDHEDVEALEEAGSGLAHGDDDEFAVGVGDAFFHEDGFGGIGIGDDDACDGGIAGVLDAEADDFDVRDAQQFDECGESADAVGQEDGELADGFAVIDDVGGVHVSGVC